MSRDVPARRKAKRQEARIQLVRRARNTPIICVLIIQVNVMRVETLIVATIYLQLIQNRYMFRSFTVLQCSHQHCVQPVASDVEVVVEVTRA